ncbi:MAG: tRNA (cytidine(34)-2'-O)-methyltransferase [Alphaproteobacteria bacterium]|nr:tRNA (cytidine(34)-2'-O)-methyltransferase [Alphaproteobacteria bacterium]
MRLALYQPDIPPNLGTLIRLGACLGVALDVIEPCGFPFDDARLKRAAMDYAKLAQVTRHRPWAAFLETRPPGRLVLLSTKAAESYLQFAFAPDDILLLGRESAGVPDEVHSRADARLRIPLVEGARALNVALAAAMVLGEALRQTGGFESGVSR